MVIYWNITLHQINDEESWLNETQEWENPNLIPGIKMTSFFKLFRTCLLKGLVKEQTLDIERMGPWMPQLVTGTTAQVCEFESCVGTASAVSSEPTLDLLSPSLSASHTCASSHSLKRRKEGRKEKLKQNVEVSAIRKAPVLAIYTLLGP